MPQAAWLAAPRTGPARRQLLPLLPLPLLPLLPLLWYFIHLWFALCYILFSIGFDMLFSYQFYFYIIFYNYILILRRAFSPRGVRDHLSPEGGDSLLQCRTLRQQIAPPHRLFQSTFSTIGRSKGRFCLIFRRKNPIVVSLFLDYLFGGL